MISYLACVAASQKLSASQRKKSSLAKIRSSSVFQRNEKFNLMNILTNSRCFVTSVVLDRFYISPKFCGFLQFSFHFF